jgi:hypothetical protein
MLSSEGIWGRNGCRALCVLDQPLQAPYAVGPCVCCSKQFTCPWQLAQQQVTDCVSSWPSFVYRLAASMWH